MTLQAFLAGLYAIVGTYIIPTIIFLCVVVFLFNVIRFFIWQSGSEAGRENARRYLVWSMVGFILVLALWGIVSLLLTSFGFGAGAPVIQPDYFDTGVIIGP